MAAGSGKVHVVRVRKTGYVDKQGRQRDYSSAYLRRTFREGGKVRNETVANLSSLPEHVIDLIDAGLKGTALVPAAAAVTIARPVPHGHVAAVHADARQLGLPALLGPAGLQRDLAWRWSSPRVARPGSKLSTLAWWMTPPRRGILGWPGPAPMRSTRRWTGWAGGRDSVEAGSRPGTWRPGRIRGRMALFDLSSSWMEGSCVRWPPAATPDGKKGRAQIEYGLLTDPEGPTWSRSGLPREHRRPGRVHPDRQGRAGEKLGLATMVMVGDRGMTHQRPDRGAEQFTATTASSCPAAPTGGSPPCAPPPSRS
jgi:hypothetical protein